MQDVIIKKCFHCREAIDDFTNIDVEVDGGQKRVCCFGCKAAFEFINNNQLTEFYQRRDFNSDVVYRHRKPQIKSIRTDWSFLDDDSCNSKYVSQSGGSKRYINIYVQGIYCSSCNWLIDKALSQISSDIKTSMDVSAKRLFLEITDPEIKIAKVMQVIENIGYQPNPIEINSRSLEIDDQVKTENHQALKRIAIAGLGMMQVMSYAVGLYFGDFHGMDPTQHRFLTLLSMFVATIVVFYAGIPFFKNALNDIKNYHLGMDVPIAIAICGAYFPSVYQTLFRARLNIQGDIYFDSAVMFIFFLSVGRYIEMRARHRNSDSPSAMNRLLPPIFKISRLKSENYFDLWIQPNEIKLGDKATIVRQQTIPFDAVIVSGEALIDESLITGESQPLLRRAGELVAAGSITVKGNIEIKATKVWADSSIAKIETIISKAKLSSGDDNEALQTFARKFVTAILCLTLIVGFIWLYIEPTKVFEIVLAMLVASCPCAFSLAGPTGLAAASHVLRVNGLLLTNYRALKIIPSVSAWCFDKTGTLSKGKPSIKHVSCYSSLNANSSLKIAAAMESGHTHILSTAFSVVDFESAATNAKQFPGNGISATIDGTQYYLGRPAWVMSQLSHFHKAEILQDIELHSQDSVVGLASKDEYFTSFFIQDKIRPQVTRVLDLLKSISNKVIVLSGDRQSVVDSVTKDFKLDQVIGDQLPEDKMQFVLDLQAQGEIVAMVGDGVNDAPVITQADLSVAMSNGSELSMTQSDVIILNGQLTSLNLLRLVASKTLKITRQNINWALSYNLIVLPLAAFGLLTPWIAALGMSISSLFVVLNASRIGNNKYKHKI